MSITWDTLSEYNVKLGLLLSSSESSCSDFEDSDDDGFQNCFEMSTSVIEVLDTTPKMGRRSMALADIDPKYVSQSGIWEASDIETSRGGSIRIQHLTSAVNAAGCGSKTGGINSIGTAHYGSSHPSTSVGFPSILATRFPKLEECAHFHYDILELPVIKISLRDDGTLKSNPASKTIEEEISTNNINGKESFFSLEVVSGGQQSWIIQRTIQNFIKLDEQIHRCVWDRSFSHLPDITEEIHLGHQNSEVNWNQLLKSYLNNLSQLPTNQITCGSVLSWFEIDNRGRHIVSSDDAALNTPAVAAALAIRSYVAEAPDELSFQIGEMISVIDLPPPEESVWLRGKLTRESSDLGSINFEVGFFPRECVEIIGDKGKIQSGVTPVLTTRKLAKVSLISTSPIKIPDKPVLRKHGKIISFFRSMMSRPEKRVLQQKGILRERVFNCDLAEHLLNTGSEVPVILTTCANFIEQYGVSDGIYRISGSLRNTQRLRRLFDAEEIPSLEEDESIRQDVHAVSSVLKQYFRELPNPLCTYQLYDKFVLAISPASNKERFENIKQVIKELPPPHYRTLEYLMLHLHKMTAYSDLTGMTAQNMAIVWAPNLIRCRDLEGGNAAEFKGVTNHVIVTEFIIRYSERFFGKDPSPLCSDVSSSGRPESLLLASSSPMKLMSLEAAKEKFREGRSYIDVGAGPTSLPQQFHTVIDVSKSRGSAKSKNPLSTAGSGLKNFFTRNRSFSKGPRKTSTGVEINVLMNTATNLKDGNPPGFGNSSLRPVKSVESLSSPYKRRIGRIGGGGVSNIAEDDEPNQLDLHQLSNSSPASPIAESLSIFYVPEPCQSTLSPPSCSLKDNNNKTHNRSISHDSYFEDPLQFKLELKNVLVQESLTEESPQSENDITNESTDLTAEVDVHQAPITPDSFTSSREPIKFPQLSPSSSMEELYATTIKLENPVKPRPKPRYSKLRDCQVQTSMTTLNDVGVSTDNDVELLSVGPGTIVSMDTNHRKSTVIEVYQYPTFNDAERQELAKQYELERNSSADDTSTDTTPVEDLFNQTSIVYSPLIEDSTSPLANLSHSVVQPVDGLFHCPLYESREKSPCLPQVTERRPKVHPYENVTNIVKTKKEIEKPQLELEILTNSEVSTPFPETINLNQEKPHYENISFIKITSSLTSAPFDDVSESLASDFKPNKNISQSICEQQETFLKEEKEYPEILNPEEINDVLISPSPEIYDDESNLIDLSDKSAYCFDSKDKENTSLSTSKSEELGVQEDFLINFPVCPVDSPSEPPSPATDNIVDTGEEFRHIDSPLVVDNPLYRIEFENEDSESLVDENLVKQSREDPNEIPTPQKILNRCNSAPMTFTTAKSMVSEILDLETSENSSSKIEEVSSVEEKLTNVETSNPDNNQPKRVKILLSKRLSEPLLNVSKQEEKTSLPASWKIPDGIRLTHRKQSVKELLNKFESTSHESISSMTMSLSPDEAKATTTISTGPGGLPRPQLRKNPTNTNPSEVGGCCLRDKNNIFASLPQHHRFSVGDIMMSQSLNSTDVMVTAKETKKGAITRSDTLPELRNDSAKENDSTQGKRFRIPDKVQQLFEAANTTLDNNNPETRERIERYKLNRRIVLREKFSTAQIGNSNETDLSKQIENRESTSSVESVFTTPTTTEPCSSSLSVTVYSVESPRKRALSEDVSQMVAQSQFKSFKPEQNFRESCKSESSASQISGFKPNIKGPKRKEGLASSTTSSESMSAEPGRKIKDIAAFFEKKQF